MALKVQNLRGSLRLQVPLPSSQHAFLFPKMSFYSQNCPFFYRMTPFFEKWPFIFQKCLFLSWNCFFLIQKFSFVFQKCFLYLKNVLLFSRIPFQFWKAFGIVGISNTFWELGLTVPLIIPNCTVYCEWQCDKKGALELKI